jgi:hypothetical protein
LGIRFEKAIQEEREERMKRRFMTLGLACASIGLFAVGTSAQQYRLVAKIPFNFTVRERSCPAGVYELNAGSYSNYEALHNVKGKCSLFVNSRRSLSEAAGNPRLVFRRYGESYFLSTIWNGQGTGSIVPSGTREEHLRQATPASEMATTVVNGAVGQ